MRYCHGAIYTAIGRSAGRSSTHAHDQILWRRVQLTSCKRETPRCRKGAVRRPRVKATSDAEMVYLQRRADRDA